MTSEQLVIDDPIIAASRKSDLLRTPMDLLAYAVQNERAIEIIKELRAMCEEDRARTALQAFNDAMKVAQDEISEVIPDMTNEKTKGKYASYKALNREIRPVYLRNGFSLSFNAAPSEKPDEILVLCDCSHKGGHTKQYVLPMSTDGKGPQGGGVMSKPQAALAATSYGRSGLLKLIFNIAIGEAGAGMDQDELQERLDYFSKCKTISEVFEHFKASYLAAEEIGDVKAQIALSEAKENRKQEIQDARAKS